MSGGGGRQYNPPVPEADVTNLVADLAAKAAAVHGHAEADVAALITDLADKLTKASVTPVDVPFNGANFTASGGMTWTVTGAEQLNFSYVQLGDHLIFLTVILLSTTIGGAPSDTLFVALPFVAALPSGGAAIAQDGAVGFKAALAQIVAGTGTLLIRLAPIVNWTIGASEGIVVQLLVRI